jgi:DNA-directed RNA polymerase subunit RPC12/RpoP
MRKPSTSAYAQWKTACPYCGNEGKLIVVEAVLTATGETIAPYSELCADGFDVDPRLEMGDIRSFSTEEEIVRCTECRAEFPLGDLSL